MTEAAFQIVEYSGSDDWDSTVYMKQEDIDQLVKIFQSLFYHTIYITTNWLFWWIDEISVIC